VKISTRVAILTIVLLAGARSAAAHEVRPAYLEMHEVDVDTYDVLWKVPARGEYRLGIHVQLPEGAERVGGIAAAFQAGSYVERWRLRRPGGLEGSTIRIDGLSATRIDVLVRVERADGATQTARAFPDHPYFTLEAKPSLGGVVWTYLVLGIEHILLGFDHLLFVLALVLIVKSRRKLVETVTAFTAAHSITLAAAALGYVSVPTAPVEACIALSIAFVAAELVHAKQGRRGLTERAPWLVAFTFGLLHGFGFASALSNIGLPHGAIPLALLMFNVGVEIGQLMFIAAILMTRFVVGRLPVPAPRWGWRIAPYVIGTVAMFWVIERTIVWL